ncbi:ABC transporter ATP-binding protein [Streptomyces sp. NPDC059582]|uniref:ABC transporter ATP-binding protein n=1 Tax=Streptomyces sp. NPDC059582 TaxID=3346875 RepID=UPI00369944BD
MALSLDRVEVTYGRVVALRGITATVEDGRILGVLGANGAGKSSLVDAIVGRVPYRGHITGPAGSLDGLPTWRRLRQGVGFVPQDRDLIGELTVEENILVATAGSSRRQAFVHLARSFEDFPKLVPLRHRKVGHLSGGERQLTAIARALVRRPSTLVLDEPSLGLSPTMRETVVASVLRRCRDDGLAVLLVEQFTDLVLAFADDVLVMSNGSTEWNGPRATLDAATIQRAYLGEAGPPVGAREHQPPLSA